MPARYVAREADSRWNVVDTATDGVLYSFESEAQARTVTDLLEARSQGVSASVAEEAPRVHVTGAGPTSEPESVAGSVHVGRALQGRSLLLVLLPIVVLIFILFFLFV